MLDSKMLDSIHALLPELCTCATDAGRLIHHYYEEKNFTVKTKEDKTPVTQADWDAHLLIVERISKLSSFPIISEESYKDEAISAESPFWLVDPLDGTREFINRTGDFTVNIALVDKTSPVLGIIYAPLTQELYYASHQHGAFKHSPDKGTVKIQTRTLNPNTFTALFSRYQEHEALLKRWPQIQTQRLGSSLKYCRIAEGSADLYIRRRPSFEWDTAAAQCILEESGGILLDAKGDRLRYRKPHILNESIVALGDSKVKTSEYL